MNAPKIDFKNPKIQFVIFTIVLAVGGGVAWYYLLYKNDLSTVRKLHTQKARRERELKTILALKPQLEQLRKEARVDSARLRQLKSMFPDQKEIPKLIREITKVARASSIHTKKFNPLPDVEKEYYIENKYNIIVEGGYHQLANFFAFLANMPLIINLGKVKIATNPQIGESIETYNELGGLITSTVASFEMTTFSSRQ